MVGKLFWMGVCLAGLVGCSGVPSVPLPAQLPWHDANFAYDASLVSVTKEDLFRLEPELAQQLRAPELRALSLSRRFEHLLTLLYGREMKPFPYVEGHSTVAAETWRLRRGDCLSLTVLAFAMARAMDMTAQMQEVRVPVQFDRRGGVDFLNLHVNLLFRRSGPMKWAGNSLQSDDMVVDFEPQAGSSREGQALSDNAILSRYYNNVAAEHLARNEDALAYAHFKAAILAEPAYAPSYANLATLYRRAGLQDDAEDLLRRAIVLGGDDTVALLSLHRLLLDQGRTQEASEIARLVQSRRDRDPYYWIGLGLKHLQGGRYRESVHALEEAEKLTHGFKEVHSYLALAYWRVGERARANEQLTLLASLHPDSADVVTLRRKFKTAPTGY